MHFSIYGMVIVCLLHFVEYTFAADNELDTVRTLRCLGCLCQAASKCDSKPMCDSEVCGPFRMTRPYWLDSDQPTVGQMDPDAEYAFETCANDMNCATETVRSYVTKFSQDCNADKIVNCQDYARIHYFGGYNCATRVTDPEAIEFLSKTDKCFLNDPDQSSPANPSDSQIDVRFGEGA